jgi:hypothetical protein
VTTAAGRRITSSAERLMDGLLDVEDEAFAALDAGLQRTADAARQNITGARSRTALLRAQLLPDDEWLGRVLLPPISELAAVARERALRVVDAQLGALAGAIGEHADPVAAVARRATASQAASVELGAFTDAAGSLEQAAAATRERITEQRRAWNARREPTAGLVARVCSAERVALPGAASRGAIWVGLRTPTHAAARAVSVRVANELLLTAYRGWNRAAAAAE